MTHKPGQPPPIVLASASPRRRELLTQLGVDFELRPSDVDETPAPDETPSETQKRITLAKAAAVNLRGADHAPGTIVIACDTTVLLDGAMLNKPADAAEARAMLTALRGREHVVQSCLVVRRTALIEVDMISSRVSMRAYSDAEIEAYIASGDPFDKAGSYAVQHPVFQPVTQICGCPLNVIGLSLCRLRALVPELPACGAVCERWFGVQCPAAMTKQALDGHCVPGQTQP
jgi:septum formation protein